MLYVYRFNADCGSAGSLDGMFVCADSGKAKLDKLIADKTYVHFGEVLGKHSDVGGAIEPDEITLVEASQDDIAAMLRVFGLTGLDDWCTISGYNPLDYANV